MNECKRCAATLRNPQALLCPLCQQYDQAVRDREEYMTINRELIENNRELLRMLKDIRAKVAELEKEITEMHEDAAGESI